MEFIVPCLSIISFLQATDNRCMLLATPHCTTYHSKFKASFKNLWALLKFLGFMLGLRVPKLARIWHREIRSTPLETLTWNKGLKLCQATHIILTRAGPLRRNPIMETKNLRGIETKQVFLFPSSNLWHPFHINLPKNQSTFDNAIESLGNKFFYNSHIIQDS